MSIPGVGPMTAAHFVLAVDDADRFEKSKNVGAYFGLTPRRRQSGEMDYNCRCPKALCHHAPDVADGRIVLLQPCHKRKGCLCIKAEKITGLSYGGLFADDVLSRAGTKAIGQTRYL
jgi:hypothetical protein